jgi:hypothetical protein
MAVSFKKVRVGFEVGSSLSQYLLVSQKDYYLISVFYLDTFKAIYNSAL